MTRPITTAPADTARAMHAAEMRGLDMQDAPEQIWAWKWDFPYARKVNGKCEWSSVAYPQEQAVTKYITEAECQRRIDAAVQAEREACAKVQIRKEAPNGLDFCEALVWRRGWKSAMKHKNAAIRARGQK